MKFGNRTSGFRKLKGDFVSGVVKMHHKHIDFMELHARAFSATVPVRGNIELTNGDERVGKS